MKVLMATPYYFPVIGGTESFIESLSLNLINRGVIADVATLNIDHSCKPICHGKIEKIKVNVFSLRKKQKKLSINNPVNKIIPPIAQRLPDVFSNSIATII